MAVTRDNVDQLWAAGRGRCIYCFEDDTLFHSVCDCFYHEKVCNIADCFGKDGSPLARLAKP